jgi:hypothetical protein
MYKEFIGSYVTLLVSSRGNNILEYMGTIASEDQDNLYLEKVDICCLMLDYQKGFFGNSINRYKEGLEKVVLNKKYIISCNKQ